MTEEFLVRVELTAPEGIDPDELSDLRAREAARAKELVASGNILRLWRSDSAWGNWGLWRCTSREDLAQLMASLPLYPFMTVEVHNLRVHPSDPASTAASVKG